MIDYIRDGQEIYRNSFAIIRAEADLAAIPADLEKLAVRVIHACGLANLESISFVTTFRGRQIGEGRKSVSLRLVFRKPDGTMKSEEADASVARAIAALREKLGAEIRT